MLLGMAGAYAQQNTASPYSFYALGEVKFKGTIENRMMAGLSMYSDSIHLNLQNPASYSDLKLTTYTAALSFNNLTLKNEDTKENTTTVSFNYLSLGIPISEKIGAGLGLMPYTAVGYQLESIDDTQPNTITDRYTGEGGINRVYFSLGYAITKNFSLGVTGNYNFGKIQNESLRIIEDVELATREINLSNINGLDVNLALNYRTPVRKDYMLYASLMHRPGSTLASENFRTIATVSFNAAGAESPPRDLEIIDLEASDLDETDITVPSSTTVGIGFGKDKKWFAGAEYEFRDMSKFNNPFTDIVNYEYENAYRLTLGGFFIPKYDSFTNYWNRIAYRAGVRYEKTGLLVNNTAVNDFGISFGVGLPLGGYIPNTNSLAFASMFSNINVGFDVGKRGEAASGIQENYFNLNISLSLNDKWFVKRKYN